MTPLMLAPSRGRQRSADRSDQSRPVLGALQSGSPTIRATSARICGRASATRRRKSVQISAS